jgi:hypothetical protein
MLERLCQRQTLYLIMETINYGCNKFYDTGPSQFVTSSKGNVIDHNHDKIENFTFLSITFSIFKLQKWQTPFWKAYDVRNIIGLTFVENDIFNSHFLAARPL